MAVLSKMHREMSLMIESPKKLIEKLKGIAFDTHPPEGRVILSYSSGSLPTSWRVMGIANDAPFSYM